MKKAILLLPLLLYLFIVTGCGNVENTPDKKENSSKNQSSKNQILGDGWSVEYSSSWDIIEKNYVGQTSTGKHLNYSVQKTTKAALEKWINSEIKRKSDAEEASNSLKEPLTIERKGNLTIYRYAILSKMEGSQTLLRSTVFFDGKRRFEFYTGIPPTSEEEYKAILGSFRVGIN